MIGKAALSGLLGGFSLPALFGDLSFSLGEIAWFALIPVYQSLARLCQINGSLRRCFRQGFVTGLLFYGVSLYWIFIAMHRYGEVSILASLAALVLLVVILASYLGGAFVLAAWLVTRRIPLLLSFSASWVLQDWVRNFFPFGGFSWSSLAYSQGDLLRLIQIADLTGPYGVTFLVVTVNALFGEISLFLRERKNVPTKGAVVVSLLMGLALGYGSWRLDQVSRLTESLPAKRVVLVQGNVPQEEKWLTERIEEMIQIHVSLSEEAEERYRPDLLIWPEAAYTAVVPPDVLKLGVLNSLRTPLLMGAVSYEGELPEEWPPVVPSNFRLYNGAFLIDPGGFIVGQYRKNHLVPMGEYVPLEGIFFFMQKIVPGFASFTPGGSYHLLDVEGMKVGVTICYEDLFPEISRKFTQEGADILVNLTNDAWYDRSSAVVQHLEFSRFRAIENRRFMVRATNTGVTSIFDPTGRVVAEAPLFESAVLPATIRLGGPGSLYTRFGDLFVLGLAVVTVVPLIHLRFRPKRIS